MRGGGTKLQTTKNSPANAHLLDVSRTVSRAGLRPTGIDRVERAYLERFIADETPLFGIVRTKLGYLLLDKGGCTELLQHCRSPTWADTDVLSRVTRRTDLRRAISESGVRKRALDRAMPSRLRNMLSKHLPEGSVYFNVGQTNYNDRMIHAMRAVDARIAVYLHDTIPFDWPETQTAQSRDKFRQFFQKTDRWADIVLCNSFDTKSHVLAHSNRLQSGDVHVLWPGLPDIVCGTAPDGPWIGNPYFMAVGTIEPRKNIGFLLELWKEFEGPNDPHLFVCGRRGWLSDDIFGRLDEKPANVHEFNDLDDGALWTLLKNSNGLLFPSFAEGFGYPAVEAAHLNVPLICNPLPVFKEVLGDYPIYAAESDRYVWRNKIEQLAQRRRGRGGEQDVTGGFVAPTWQVHFDKLFTLL